MENMNVNAYKPKFNWTPNDNGALGFGFVENLDTFRTFANSEIRVIFLMGWEKSLHHELNLANHDINFFGYSKNIDDIDMSKLFDDIEGNLRYYKLSFGWDLCNYGAHLGNVHKFRKLHPFFRKKMLNDWIEDIHYALKLSYSDCLKQFKHLVNKKCLTSSST